MNVNPFLSPDIEEIAFASSLNFLAIYNYAPILPGHSLIIPKRHAISIMELSELELLEFVMLSRKVIKILSHVFQSDSFDWTIQERPPAGQTVPHLHMHIIPRHLGDLPEPGDWYPKLEEQFFSKPIDSEHRPKYSRSQLIEIAQQIKEQSQHIQ